MGNLKRQEITKQEKKDGKFERYYENGQLRDIGEYKNGEAIGEWKFYDESGKLRKIEYLDD